MFFGSALTNFGVEPFLEEFLKLTPPPLPREADCGIIDTGAGRAARVKRVKPIPEPLVRAAKTYADEARRLDASLDDAFNALCAQW